MNRTTRIKTVQAPKTRVYDLSSQTDGLKQTFTLPRAVGSQDEHYLLFNSTVYKNDANHTFYTLTNGGTTLNTYLDQAPVPGDNHVLQFVVSGNTTGDEEDYVTRDEMMAAIQEAINNLRENE